ncbi:hypothetical protein A8C56_00375 [Niabella ginsenosidivorans]|uniref:PKD domain-containing protein n=1 Tax=Niabella ginsenosidivorans TaxID=1176587 RepID=A0A1A9HYY1_9BACT|nr:hypothetical protein [Niabella ginsenosidivorans]ANH79632.1 hypothetical protein A8C56_00375 [Niabella ginsenosidivorans]
MDDNQLLIEKCKSLIEQQLGWGSSASWQHQDFENLGDQVFEATGVVLSASTLKRIWGKVRYNSKPNLGTLDALSRFAGFSNWRSFAAAVTEQEQPPAPVKKRSFPKMAFLLLLLAIAFLLIGFMFLHKSFKQLNYNQVYFSSQPVTLGVPNTVVFEYDAAHSNADSVFIQQSWDPGRRFKVAKDLHTYTSTYYLPGYYRAKLILNDSIVKEHDLYIESNGWMGSVAHDPAPIYLKEKIFKKPGLIGLDQQELDQLHLDPKETPVVTLANVSRKFDVNSNNFQLDLEFQNTYSGNNSPCLHTNVVVLGTDGVLLIPFGKTGCSGELNMMLGSKAINGKTNDLSAFGVDFTRMVQLRCASKDNRIKIMINDHPAFENRFDKPIGKIVGIRLNFFGTGFIRSFQLTPAA